MLTGSLNLISELKPGPGLSLDAESRSTVWAQTLGTQAQLLGPACIQVLDVVPDPILNVVLVPGVDLAAELSPNPGPPCSTVQD